MIALASVCGLFSACASGQSISEERVATEHLLSSGGKERSYYLINPSGNEPKPLVLLLHGGGGNGNTLIEAAVWKDKALAEGFIAVFPNGTGRRDNRYTWNAGGCCAYAMTSGADDIGFMDDLLDEITANYPVDENRIYMAGISNGGMMTYRTAGMLSERLAGIATVVGAMFDDQPVPVSPVPILAINSRQDGVLPYEGGKSKRLLVRRSQRSDFLSAPEIARRWAAWNGCDPASQISQNGVVTTEKFSACSAETMFITLEEGGHGWPGGRALRESPEQASDVLNATDAIWDFFSKHSK